MKGIHTVIVLCGGLVGMQVAAQQSPNDVTTLKEIAGTYAVDCEKPGAVRVKVAVEAITLEAGTRQRRSDAPMTTHSTFGNKGPPPDEYREFLVELLSSVGSILVMEDKTGKYLVFYEPENGTIEQQFGKGSVDGKFRLCN